jgi:hypothetical protein
MKSLQNADYLTFIAGWTNETVKDLEILDRQTLIQVRLIISGECGDCHAAQLCTACLMFWCIILMSVAQIYHEPQSNFISDAAAGYMDCKTRPCNLQGNLI